MGIKKFERALELEKHKLHTDYIRM